jgi:hypothetical protein
MAPGRGAKISDWELLPDQPADYYLTEAGRARRLLEEATTPRLKQHLRELIARFEGAAAKEASASQRD